MPRYVAFLRGVSPFNAKMPELKRCFEQAGFTNVKTVLSSGNVVFDARASKEAALERKAEAAMQTALGRSFHAFIRSADMLQAMLATDPYAAFELSPGAKRVVTFLREPHGLAISTPIDRDEARILRADEREVFSACVPGPRGSVFMARLERTFGAAITTRTWDTVRKCAAA
jgi:uncharacterized protein (DUF1697 family)